MLDSAHLVLDTNIILLDATNVITLGKKGSVIVLPETVLDEIDSKKSGLNEIAFQAREFGRILSRATKIGTIPKDNLLVTSLSVDGTIINIVSLKSYPKYEEFDRGVISDRRIIEATLAYANFATGSLTFISNDGMCRFRADSVGLNTSDLKQIEVTDISFTRYLTVDSDLFSRLHNLSIAEVDDDYEPQYFNYVFTDATTGQTKLATLRNGLIDVIGKDSETELRRQDAPPTNAGQLFFSRAIQNPLVDVVVCEALAGSGKTVTALSNAVRLVKQGRYSSITYIRASVDDVDKVEEIGFLSGNDDKLAVYLHPLEDTLDFLVRSNHKDSKVKGADYEDMISEKVEKLRADCRIQGMIGLGMRGRTFTDTVAIIDEVQNMSKASLQKVLTRFGKDCKIILIGSNKQLDNPYITKYTNGLSVVLDACKRPHPTVRMHAITLTKVLRSPVAEWAENIFSK